MIEDLNCKACHSTFRVGRPGKKTSNGSFLRFYENGAMCNIKSLCHPCFRKKTNSKWPQNKKNYLKYEKTVNGFLMRLYRNMRSRVLGVNGKKSHLYSGLSILEKEEFYSWAKKSKNFHKLFERWKEHDFKRRLTPSVDRIDSSKGYVPGNMQWVQFHVNCRRGAKSYR